MTDYPRHSVKCGDLTFLFVGWWHDDPNVCNHFKPERSCTNSGGEWRPVYEMLTSDAQPTDHDGDIGPDVAGTSS